MFRVMISIAGRNFDAQRFFADRGANVGGEVLPIKQIRSDEPIITGYRWKSNAVDVRDGYPEDELLSLLDFLRPELLKLKGMEGIDVMAEIVQYIDAGESARGCFLSIDLISLLHEVGASLDLDVVPSS